jgi:hypothetical protein
VRQLGGVLGTVDHGLLRVLEVLALQFPQGCT